MKAEMKMKCGCMMVPKDRFDERNVHHMECGDCVRKSFPRFPSMEVGPDMVEVSPGVWGRNDMVI